MIRCLLALLLLATTGTGCGRTTVELAPVPAVTPGATLVELGGHIYGISICVTQPLSWVQDGMDPTLTEVVKAHEASHREMMALKGGCEAYWRWRNGDRDHAIADEAAAFCAGARKAVQTGRAYTLEQAVSFEAIAFGAYWRIGMHRARHEISTACGL